VRACFRAQLPGQACHYQDAGFLADVVIEATRAQGRVPAGFDERRWRADFGARTIDQVRDRGPGEMTSVVEVDSEHIGRVWISHTAECIELRGIQLRPSAQRQRPAQPMVSKSRDTCGVRAGLGVRIP
jgi:hypothetical protein